MSQYLDFTQNLHQYPSFDIPKLPELEFTFRNVLGDCSMDIHEEVGPKRSRVDGSQDEQNSIKKVRTLEERLAELGIPSAAAEKKVDVDVLEDVEEQGLLNARAMVKVISVLEKATKDIVELKARVDDLEAEALDTQHDLASARHKIKVHERVIKRLAGADEVDFLQEYEYDSDDEHYSDNLSKQNVQPQTDSSI